MPEISIENGRVEEASRILELQKQAYLSEAEIYGDYDIPPLTQSLQEIWQDLERFTFYVAKDGMQIIGSVNVEIDGRIGRIGRLIVAPSRQGQGIGSKLMDHVERLHADLEALDLFTGHKSERNLAIYTRRGFVEVGRQPVHAGLTLVYMRKNIANKP